MPEKRIDDDTTARDARMIAAEREIAAKLGLPTNGDAGSSGPSDRPAAAAFAAPPPDSFAGFRILKEVHRGGQGVVYKAIQESTKRTVAIKVMREGPFAGSSDKARFDREVQILGQLNHPNIVTIHDTGVAAGCRYFVMDYVSGQPLDVYMADGQRQRAIKPTLQLFAKICDAVNAAHLRGVIHRDLKPANIRIDTDGQPHVLDFGLAKLAPLGAPPLAGVGDRPVAEEPPDTPVPPAPPMTVTGQFVGSLPWASPEQAEGAPGKIDIRTDVYSLGVVLFQMLTGRFPYEVIGPMRDVLDRIMTAEPARPRSIRKQINDEVETIVLKCLQKDRARRYQSAGDLARDVQRFLSGEPIEAKRDSPAYVLRKQLSKRKLSVTVAAAFVLVVTAGFAASLAFWRQSVAKGIVADQRRVEAETERKRAEANFQRASDAVEEMTRLAEEELADVPQMQPARRALFAEALKYYRGFLQERGDDPTVRYETGRAYRRVGDIQALLGQEKDAEAPYREAIGLLEKLAVDFPLVPEYAAELARSYTALGRYRKALMLLEKLAVDHPDVPDYRAALAQVLLFIGGRQAIQQSRSISRRLAQEFPDAPDYLHGLAKGLDSTGSLMRGRLNFADRPDMRRLSDVARDSFERALEIYQELIEVYPDVRVYREGLIWGYSHRGRYQRESERHENAEQAYGHAVRLCTALANDFPAIPKYRKMLAHLHFELGSVLPINRPGEAEAVFAKGVALYTELTDDFPNSQYAADYAAALVSRARRIAQALAETAQRLEAEKEQPRAVTACYQVVPFAAPDTVAPEPPGFHIIRPAGTKLVAVRMIGSTVETFDEDATAPSSIKQVDDRTEPITVSVWRRPPPHLPAPPGLVGKWPGEGTADDVCHEQPGTLHNGVAFESGKVGRGFRFDGLDDVVRIPHRNDLQPPQITVAAWIKVGQSPDFQLVVDKSHGFINNTGWVLQIDREGPVRWAYGNGLTYLEAFSTTSVNDGRFHHVVGTLDGTMLRVYVDGILEGSVSYIGTPAGNTRPLHIGASFGGNLTSMDFIRHFNGVIDEIQVFNRALTSEEIAYLFLAESAGEMGAAANEGFNAPKVGR